MTAERSTDRHRQRSRRIRLLAAVAALATLAGSVAACGSSSGGDKGSGGSVSFTLSMHIADPMKKDPATAGIVKAFQAKYPDVKINVVGQPVEQHEQQMTIAAQSDTLPDMFWVYNSLAQTMAKNGKLLDLSPILAQNGLQAKFPQSMLSGYNGSGI